MRHVSDCKLKNSLCNIIISGENQELRYLHKGDFSVWARQRINQCWLFFQNEMHTFAIHKCHWKKNALLCLKSVANGELFGARSNTRISHAQNNILCMLTIFGMVSISNVYHHDFHSSWPSYFLLLSFLCLRS